jgi:hypothetical protein
MWLAQWLNAIVIICFSVIPSMYFFNKPWKPHKWLPVALAMPKMLNDLEAVPSDVGFLLCVQ